MKLLYTLTVALHVFTLSASHTTSDLENLEERQVNIEKVVPNDGQGIDQLGRPKYIYYSGDSMAYQGSSIYSIMPDLATLTPATLSANLNSISVSGDPHFSNTSSTPSKPSAHKNDAPRAFSLATMPISIVVLGVTSVLAL